MLKLWRDLGVQNRKRNPGSFLSDPTAMLINTREWHAKRIVIVEVSAADDRDVLRDPYSMVQGVVHCSHGHRIVKAEESIRSRLEKKKLAHSFGAALPCLHISLGFCDDVVLDDFEPALGEGSLVAFQAADARAGLRPSDMCDPLAANVD